MKIFVDNKLFKNMASQAIESKAKALVETCKQADILIDENQIQLIYQWPTLLECLDLESLFDQFFKLNEQEQLFNFLITTLTSEVDRDLLVSLYDQIFIECLTRVKNLPEINPTFLLQLIQKKKESAFSSQSKKLILPLLEYYEKYLTENPSHAMHDLILYLAWDRICVNMGPIFESPCLQAPFRQGLDVFKQCLLESFDHIRTQNRTTPSLFRLMETLYADEMRQENLQVHSENEWLILCQGARALKQREDIADVYYIDGALVNRQRDSDKIPQDPLILLTMDPVSNVESGLCLAHYLNEKIRLKIPDWPYLFNGVKIICLVANEKSYQVESVIIR